jgi:hypothetical protein
MGSYVGPMKCLERIARRCGGDYPLLFPPRSLGSRIIVKLFGCRDGCLRRNGVSLFPILDPHLCSPNAPEGRNLKGSFPGYRHHNRNHRSDHRNQLAAYAQKCASGILSPQHPRNSGTSAQCMPKMTLRCPQLGRTRLKLRDTPDTIPRTSAPPHRSTSPAETLNPPGSR